MILLARLELEAKKIRKYHVTLKNRSGLNILIFFQFLAYLIGTAVGLSLAFVAIIAGTVALIWHLKAVQRPLENIALNNI